MGDVRHLSAVVTGTVQTDSARSGTAQTATPRAGTARNGTA